MKREIRARNYWIVEIALLGGALILAYLIAREDADNRRAPVAGGRGCADDEENPYYWEGGHLRADSNYRGLLAFFSCLFLMPVGMALWVIATTHLENYGASLEQQIGAILPLMWSGTWDGWGMVALCGWVILGVGPILLSCITNRLWNITGLIMPVWFIVSFGAAFVWLGYLAYKGIWGGEL